MVLDLISNVVAFSGDFTSAVILADTSGLVDNIRNFIAPVLGLILGIIALSFLMKREFMQFMIFLGIAILVFAIFYAPDFIQNLGRDVGESVDGDISWN